MTEEQQKKLVEFVRGIAQLEKTERLFQERLYWNSERGENSYECFEDGQFQMEASIALDARRCLEECEIK